MGSMETLVAIACGFITYMLLGYLYTEKKTKYKSNFRTFKFMVVAGVMLLSAEICSNYVYVYHTTVATVVNSYDEEEDDPYLSTFTYEIDGKSYEHLYASDDNDYKYDDGEKVNILYSSKNPENCVAMRWSDSYFPYIFIEALIAIVLIFTGFVGVIQNGVRPGEDKSENQIPVSHKKMKKR